MLRRTFPALTTAATMSAGAAMAADIAGKKMDVGTVQGGNIMVDTMSGVMIDDVTAVSADIEASNGVIHVIDKVILPAS